MSHDDDLRSRVIENAIPAYPAPPGTENAPEVPPGPVRDCYEIIAPIYESWAPLFPPEYRPRLWDALMTTWRHTVTVAALTQ